jgi:hypothetical protein
MKLTPETISSKKKVFLVLLPPFLHRTRVRVPGSGSGMKKFWDPDPGYGKNISDPQHCIKL